MNKLEELEKQIKEAIENSSTEELKKSKKLIEDHLGKSEKEILDNSK